MRNDDLVYSRTKDVGAEEIDDGEKAERMDEQLSRPISERLSTKLLEENEG